MKDHWKGALAATLLMGATAGLPVQAQESACGTDRTIDIAEMTWPSAAALAHIHAIVLEQGFGCNVEIVTGDTVPTSASMINRGKPAIAPEMWTGTIQDAWEEGLENGSVEEVGLAFPDGAIEGWWVPRYTADANPGLKRVEDLPEYAELFADPEDSSQGRFYSCPPGWGCEINNAALFEAYELEDSFNLFSPGSGGNLDASIVRAFTREEPIVFYYWGPTAIMGKYDMVQLEMPPHDPEIWHCNTDPDCQPKGKSAFPTPPVIIAAASWVGDEAPIVVEYLGKVTLTSQDVSSLLSWGDENQADAATTAENFLRTQEDVWTQWVPEDVAERVRASLG
ncbi:MAG: ABC transporter substrate-binding protein [Devosia sp.]|nr:ABC transporter substrate-binding protein [Devosia sp.]